KKSKLSTGNISRLCSDTKYKPKYSTISQIVRGLKKLGKNIDENDFWM
ncbi:transcriptional regulator, partial [Bacillus thuringiensis]|nr:transcriptional regulator [Bacillus thuringiensis]